MNYLYWWCKFEHPKIKGDLVDLAEHMTFYTKAYHLRSVDFLKVSKFWVFVVVVVLINRTLYKGWLSVCSGLAPVQWKIHQEATRGL